jgi:hypothetical protein
MKTTAGNDSFIQGLFGVQVEIWVFGFDSDFGEKLQQ